MKCIWISAGVVFAVAVSLMFILLWAYAVDFVYNEGVLDQIAEDRSYCVTDDAVRTCHVMTHGDAIAEYELDKSLADKFPLQKGDLAFGETEVRNRLEYDYIRELYDLGSQDMFNSSYTTGREYTTLREGDLLEQGKSYLKEAAERVESVNDHQIGFGLAAGFTWFFGYIGLVVGDMWSMRSSDKTGNAEATEQPQQQVVPKYDVAGRPYKPQQQAAPNPAPHAPIRVKGSSGGGGANKPAGGTLVPISRIRRRLFALERFLPKKQEDPKTCTR